MVQDSGDGQLKACDGREDGSKLPLSHRAYRVPMPHIGLEPRVARLIALTGTQPTPRLLASALFDELVDVRVVRVVDVDDALRVGCPAPVVHVPTTLGSHDLLRFAARGR